MKVNVKMGKMAVATTLPDDATVKTLRELLKGSMPGYDDKKFIFLKGGIPLATDAEHHAKLSENEEIVVTEEKGPVNIKMVMESGQKKVACIDRGKTLSDVRTAITGWPELENKNFFFFSGAESDAYCVEKTDEGKVVLNKDATYAIKLDEEMATNLADIATKKKEDADEKKKAKEDTQKTKEEAQRKETQERLKALMSDMKAEVPVNGIKAIADMNLVTTRDFHSADKLLKTSFQNPLEFDVTNDFFSFADDQSMLFDLINRTGILKGVIVGSTQGELVQHGFFNILKYEKPVSANDSYFAEMKKKYLAQLNTTKKKEANE